MEIKEGSKKNSFIDKTIDFAFSNDSRKWLIIILLIGFILRLIVSHNVGFIADEVVHGTHAINIISSGVINEMSECPVWFYLTDISYRIFGVNALSSRFISVFFGSLTIILVYLISRRLSNEKLALIASFLMAISAYHIRYALSEMDEAMIFFVLFSLYYFIKGLDKKELSYISVILLAIAVLIKPIAIMFGFSMGIYFLIFLFKSEKEIINKNKKRILVSIFIIILFSTPILAYNYILYKQKGITDILFSRFFNINQKIYEGLAGYSESFSFASSIEGVPIALKGFIFKSDPIISLLAILGILLIFFKKEFYKFRFITLAHLIPFFFLTAAGGRLPTHFVSFMPIISILCAIFVYFITEMVKDRSKRKILLFVILIIIFLINIYILFPFLKSESGVFKMRAYASSEINDKDIVIVDSRIYRGRIAWIFNDKNYLEGVYTSNFFEFNKNLSSNSVRANLYYIECVPDDCGWGTINSQPEFNKSMEDVTNFFKNNSNKEKVIYGGGGYDDSDSPSLPYFIIYKTTVPVNPQVYPWIKQSHDWFYYPVRWEKSDWYDKYSPKGFFQTSLNLLGRFSLWIAIIISLLSIGLVFKELFKYKINN